MYKRGYAIFKNCIMDGVSFIMETLLHLIFNSKQPESFQISFQTDTSFGSRFQKILHSIRNLSTLSVIQLLNPSLFYRFFFNSNMVLITKERELKITTKLIYTRRIDHSFECFLKTNPITPHNPVTNFSPYLIATEYIILDIFRVFRSFCVT